MSIQRIKNMDAYYINLPFLEALTSWIMLTYELKMSTQ